MTPNAGDTRLIAFAALLVVAAGYAFVFRPAESRIGDQLAADAILAERTVADRALLAMRPVLERERAREQARLRGVDVAADPTRAVATFLRDAAAAAAAHRTRFATIAANVQPGAPRNAALPLDVTLEGAYVDVLATMRALSRGRIPAAVEIASLARKNVDGGDATLSATLRVALEHQTKDDDRVRTRPH